MKIIGLGDSLMQDNFAETYPQTGWFQMLKLFVADDVTLKNFAKNGCSTKSFIDQKRFKKALEATEEGDLVLISFGHNDEKQEDPLRYCSAHSKYVDNLKFMVNSFLKKNATPILLTSVPRCKFDSEGKLMFTHGDYPKAMIQASKDTRVNVIDLNGLMREYLKKCGPVKSKENYMILPRGSYSNFPNSTNDTSHLNYNGAFTVANIVVNELVSLIPDSLSLCFRHNQSR